MEIKGGQFMSANYKDLDIKNKNTFCIFEWNGKDINIKQNISTSDKYDIVMISLQEAEENGYVNSILLDMYFHLNLVYIYTDIVFEDTDREDPFKLYDELKNSGFMDAFLDSINEADYQEMLDAIDEIKYYKFKYGCSLSSIAQKFIDDLPANAKAAMDIVDNFEPEKFKAVQDFAKAANGGRDIS
jgi:hypothetical protein